MSIWEQVQEYILSLNYTQKTSIENLIVKSILSFEGYCENEDIYPFDDSREYIKLYTDFMNDESISNFDYI